jgi:ferrous iron transport protein B
MGNPNSGKSTLFNRLTGLRQSTANYPGVTVEKHTGIAKLDHVVVELVDLPGTFSLGAHSLEERIAVDVVLGRMQGVNTPAGILAVVATNNLYQGLFLVSQLSELGLPLVIALTMSDAAEAAGVRIDIDTLEKRLGGARVCPVVATTGQGLGELRRALANLPEAPPPCIAPFWPELRSTAAELAAQSNGLLRPVEIERALIDGVDDTGPGNRVGESLSLLLREARVALFDGKPPVAEEAQRRYDWVRRVLADVQTDSPRYRSLNARFAAWINRPVPGTIGLFVVMAVVFQAVFAWATPLMDAIDGATAVVGTGVAAALPPGAFGSLISDGIIAGVGSVIIFLPQIMILFLFIIVLEDSGYLARAAYLMDRVMRSAGLSGQSIIPMISSFACAVPGIMATRVIPNRRDRIATILAAPFMTCSARLPVYALLIAAFVPASSVGWFNLQGMVLFGLYLLGIVAGILTALLLKQTALRGPKPAFALMLPEFRRPNLRTVAIQMLERVRIFLRRAGTVIFTVAVIVWALAYYPRSDDVQARLAASESAAETSLSGVVLEQERSRLANEAAAAQLEQSWLGRAGKIVAPVFAPLGWDWKISAAVIAGFPAREVVVAVLGTVYAVGDEVDESTLSQRLRSASWPDGSPVFTLPMVLGLLIFYACCLQCAATLAVIRRETNSWRWPVFAWCYMTTIGYVGALLVYQLGSS